MSADGVPDLGDAEGGQDGSQVAQEGRGDGQSQSCHRLHFHHLPFGQMDSKYLRIISGNSSFYLWNMLYRL